MKREGQVIAFDTQEEAEAEAKAARTSVSRFSQASFRYTARPLDE